MKLLNDGEAKAFEIFNANGKSRLLLVCDHASSSVPAGLDNLGLRPEQLNDHIGWDAGTAELAKGLSRHLDATLVVTNYSRLVIDCNRPPGHSESIPEQSHGIQVPGNVNLSSAQRGQREAEIFQPYHDAISELLDARPKQSPVMWSIHSFTPMLRGKLRPWSIGVCYGDDRRLADLLLPELRQRLDSGVGENQPYAIEDGIDFTLPRHAARRELYHAMLELSRDQLEHASGVKRWVSHLAEVWKVLEPRLPL